MQDPSEFFSQDELDAAKKRIWNKMQGKLPERGYSAFQAEVSALKEDARSLRVSRLDRVRSKERLLDLLPERVSQPWSFWLFPRKVLAFSSLGLFLSMIFLPLFQTMPLASAERGNVLTVAQGKVFVDGVLIENKILVEEGSFITTEPGAMAHIEFADDSRVSLAPSTEIELLALDSNPNNSADSEMLIETRKGRVWVQVLNLVGDSSFTVLFPDGQVTAQKASFDLQVDQKGMELQMAQNLADVLVVGKQTYSGTLGQGAQMRLQGEDLLLGELSETSKEDVWWDFNVAYGKEHLRKVDAAYKNERIQRVNILPGHPLYRFKTFQESLQEAFTFSKPAKERLIAQHAENRLAEAQALVDLGREDEAQVLLEATLDDAGEDTVVALLDQTQKEQLVNQSHDTVLIQEQLADKVSETQVITSSQSLDLIPDLLEAGDVDTAMDYLKDYQENALSILVELQSLPLDEREAVIEELLAQKLEDLQKLRLIAGLMDDESLLETQAQVYEEMSLMVLGLREESLEDLSDFFVDNNYGVELQEQVYEQVKDSVDLSPALEEQFAAVEEELKAEADGGVILDMEPVDGRFIEDLVGQPHTDEPQDEPEGSKEATNNPETHDDL